MNAIDPTNAAEVAKLTKELLEAFGQADVKLKPQIVKNNCALAIPYVTARAVMTRLDKVLGIDGWRDEYMLLPNGSVECRLSVRLAGVWITKSDVGSPSEQPDEGDRTKAGYSDAFKRAAVKFGVGRYLYDLAPNWMNYDPQTKQIIRGTTPAATPAPAQPKPAAPAPKPPAPKPPTYREAIFAKIDAAKNREQMIALYRQYEADLKAKLIPIGDETPIELKFAEGGKRYPEKPSQAPIPQNRIAAKSA